MARKLGYWEQIENHIQEIIAERKIEHVLHFTRLENLPTILEFGILSRSELAKAPFTAYASDVDRLDGKDGAVSVSISCYYPDMFSAKRYRAPGSGWCILTLHPSILWRYECHFYRRGAAKSDTKHERGKRHGGFALEKLFEDCSFTNFTMKGFRAQCGLPLSWPTFSDSEVQVLSSIHPDFIMGACVETPDHGEFVRAAFNAAGRADCELEVYPFEPRICRKPFYWG